MTAPGDADLSLEQIVARLTPQEQDAVLAGLDLELLPWDWSWTGRPSQILPVLPEEGGNDWSLALFLGGRGSGKSRSGSEWLREVDANWHRLGRAPAGTRLRVSLLGRTASDVRDTMIQGEALALDTLVPTPGGWRTMGSLIVGDELYGGDGQVCRVTEAFPVLHDRPCYRMTIEGAEVIADAEHKWVTSTRDERGYAGRPGYPKPRYEQVRTTAEIAGSVRTTGLWVTNQHGIAVTAIEGESKALPVAPYTLGYWLGDGTKRNAYITSHPDDQPFIRAEIEKEGYETRMAYGQDRRGYTFLVRDLSCELILANVLRNKHVPDEYFTASRAQRLALLRGLMDSDGTVSTAGQFEFSNKDPQLVFAVVALLAGLGVKSRVVWRPSGQARVRGTTGLPIFSLPRKAARIPAARGEQRWRYVSEVEPVDSVPVRCIAVDSPDRTFLVTEHYVRTHNSGLLNIYPPSLQDLVEYIPSRRRVNLPGGAHITLFSADEPDQLRGPQSHISLVDELASHKQVRGAGNLTAWENLAFGTRLGTCPQTAALTTPRRVASIKTILKDAKTNQRIILRRSRTAANAHLDIAWYQTLLNTYAGTEKGRQELDGEVLGTVAGAMTSQDMIDRFRVAQLPPGDYFRFVGLDPSTSESFRDEAGIVVVYVTKTLPVSARHAYILDDLSDNLTPDQWAEKAVKIAHRHRATIIVEVNQGGAMVRNSLQQVARSLKIPCPPIRETWSSKAKAIRAEPVGVATARGRVHMVGSDMELLEDEQGTWVPGDSYSPNRLDAMVFGVVAGMFDASLTQGAPGSVAWRTVSDRRVDLSTPPRVRTATAARARIGRM